MEGESLCPVPEVPGSEPLGGVPASVAGGIQTGSAPSACYSPHAPESGSKQASKIVQASEDTHLLPHPSQQRGRHPPSSDGQRWGREKEEMEPCLWCHPMSHKASPARPLPGSGVQGCLLTYGKLTALHKHTSVRMWSVHLPRGACTVEIPEVWFGTPGKGGPLELSFKGRHFSTEEGAAKHKWVRAWVGSGCPV